MLNHRIRCMYIQIHNILNPEQLGFRPNATTTDSLFILQHLPHPTDEQLGHVDIFFSNYYNLESVYFE